MVKKKTLKPSDIRNKDFSKKLFGYNPDEVEAFLNDVANAYQELLKEVEQLKKSAPEYKVEEIVEKARKKIDSIVKEKVKEKEFLEKKKKELEMEIEKLNLVQRKVYGKLKLAILEMTKILEELKPNAKGKKEEGWSGNRSQGSAEVFQEQDREGGGRKAEDKGNGSSGGGEGK